MPLSSHLSHFAQSGTPEKGNKLSRRTPNGVAAWLLPLGLASLLLAAGCTSDSTSSTGGAGGTLGAGGGGSGGTANGGTGGGPVGAAGMPNPPAPQGGMGGMGGTGQGGQVGQGGQNPQGGMGGMTPPPPPPPPPCNFPAAGTASTPMGVVATFESEMAELRGAATALTTGTGHSGSVAKLAGVEGGVRFTVVAPLAGIYTIQVKHASMGASSLSLQVNCQNAPAPIQFADTGSLDSTWATSVTFQAKLQAGNNHVTLSKTAAAGGPNIDSLQLTEPPPCNVVGETLCEGETAYLGGTTLATVGGTDFTGTGYAEAGVGFGAVVWLVNVPVAGDYPVSFRYTQGLMRTMALSVNGVQIEAAVPFTNTMAWGSGWVSDITRMLTLKAGLNTIHMDTTADFGVNFDSMTITGPGGPPPTDAGVPDGGVTPPADASTPADGGI